MIIAGTSVPALGAVVTEEDEVPGAHRRAPSANPKASALKRATRYPLLGN